MCSPITSLISEAFHYYLHPPPPLSSSLKIQSTGGNETNDAPFLRDVSGPVFARCNPDCHNSAKSACSATWEHIDEKVPRGGSQGQEWGAGQMAEVPSAPGSWCLRVMVNWDVIGIQNNDDADATRALFKLFLHTHVITFIFTTTLQQRLGDDK